MIEIYITVQQLTYLTHPAYRKVINNVKYLSVYPAEKSAVESWLVHTRGCLNVTFASSLCRDGKPSINAMILFRITSLAAVNSSFPTPSLEADVHCAAVPSVWPMAAFMHTNNTQRWQQKKGNFRTNQKLYFLSSLWRKIVKWFHHVEWVKDLYINASDVFYKILPIQFRSVQFKNLMFARSLAEDHHERTWSRR